MFGKKSKILNENLDKLNSILLKYNIQELSYIIGSRKELLKRNLIAGIARGVGIGIGITIITAILIYLLQKLVKLNIPVIGEYITDIINIVQGNKLY